MNIEYVFLLNRILTAQYLRTFLKIFLWQILLQIMSNEHRYFMIR